MLIKEGQTKRDNREHTADAVKTGCSDCLLVLTQVSDASATQPPFNTSTLPNWPHFYESDKHACTHARTHARTQGFELI